MPDNQIVAVSRNGRQVEFEYDAFGRRTAKKSNGVVTNFVWDGDVILSENKDSQIVTEYIHDRFVPLAKFSNNRRSKLITPTISERRRK